MINLDGDHQALSNEVIEQSGINFNACLQCRTCTNGCPFIDGMDYDPNAVIRMVQLGMKNRRLHALPSGSVSDAIPVAADAQWRLISRR